ncbi:hypothetical protein [Hymenobacter persicinus]|uniref:Glycosyltransferase RgtA/B/C/D-like domain-containing protein n=1 Tax=Hymenobacter persicinus TaxID=2025506 RepID=A0A4Q5LEM6_9BACT|nr:hypothetical protein [Hymenobacter persicinus]RYU80770.1 hypothetical protein EWM57_07935 [Hymenobacter persicinus]
MSSELQPGRYRQFIIHSSAFLILLLCLLLPTRNSTLDAWYYAACVRHGHELLLPHHLLYNPAGWLWVKLLHLLGLLPDTLAALKLLNALAAGATLLTLTRLLRRLGQPDRRIAAWTLVVGASFGLLRFATENEAYVLPVLFSMLGSLSWTRYRLAAALRLPPLLAAGFWAALACLFHQIHFFWWLGLLLGTGWYGRRKGLELLVFALPALLVPAAYAAALSAWNEPLTVPALWRFVFHDYYAGLAGGSGSGHGVLLTVANLVRTFVQVHGSLTVLVRAFPVLYLVLFSCAGFFGWAAWSGWRSFQNRLARTELAPTGTLAAVRRTHGLILILQLAFAAYSEGNAEFMVMLPALFAVVGSGLAWLPARSLGAAGAGMLLWNLAFGLVPSHFLRFTNTAALLTAIPAQPRTWFLLDNHNLVLNQLHYYSGNPVGPPNVLPAPTLLVQRPGQSAAWVRAWVQAQHRAGRRVLTDCLGSPRLLDRAQLVYGDQNAALLRGFRAVRLDSFPTFFGPRYLTEILPPASTSPLTPNPGAASGRPDEK